VNGRAYGVIREFATEFLGEEDGATHGATPLVDGGRFFEASTVDRSA
jgi:hypothetical protein